MTLLPEHEAGSRIQASVAVPASTVSPVCEGAITQQAKTTFKGEMRNIVEAALQVGL